MEFSRREYWSGLPFPSRGDFPDPGIEPTSPAQAGGFFTNEPPWRPTTPSRLHVYGRVIIFATKQYFFDGIFSSKLDNPTSHTFLGPLEFLGCIRAQECLSGFAHLVLIFIVSENSVPRILWCRWVSGSQGPSSGFGFPCLCYPLILCFNRRRQTGNLLSTFTTLNCGHRKALWSVWAAGTLSNPRLPASMHTLLYLKLPTPGLTWQSSG